MENILNTASDDVSALRADLANLQRDVATLVKNAASGIRTNSTNALGNLDGMARNMVDSAAQHGGAAVKTLGTKIEEKPIVTLLILLAASYAVGRLLTR